MDTLLEYAIQKLSKLILDYAPNNNYANADEELVYKKSPVEADLTQYMIDVVGSMQYIYYDHLRLIEEMSGIHRSSDELCELYNRRNNPRYINTYIDTFDVTVLIDNERWERGLRDFCIAEFFINIYEKISEIMLAAIDEDEDEIGFFEMISGNAISSMEGYMEKHDLFFVKKADLNEQENTSVSNAPIIKSGVSAPRKRH